MIQKGDKMPRATVYEMNKGTLQSYRTDELWGKGNVVIFGIPGAFTPICSTQHVPSFVQHQEAFKKHGVNHVFCVAVNDGFTLDAWKASLNAPDFIRFISDGNGELTRALGLEMDGSAIGLGTRCQRFAMHLKEGVVQTLDVEKTPGECVVSHGERVAVKLT